MNPHRCPHELTDAGLRAERLSLERFTELFLEHGALRLRGAARCADDFLAISERFGTRWIPYRLGGRTSVSDKLQTVNVGNSAIPPHSELCHLPLQPRMLWFFCAEAGENAAATTLYDGVRLADGMPAALNRLFDGRMLSYRRRTKLAQALQIYDVSSEHELRAKIERFSWQQWLTIEHGHLLQHYVVPVLPHLAETGRRVFVNQLIHNAAFRTWTRLLAKPLNTQLGHRLDIRQLRRLGRLAMVPRSGGIALYPTFEDGSVVPRWAIEALCHHTRQHEVAVHWSPGDILVVDNKRFLHGRRAINAERRKILTRFGHLRSPR